MSYCLVHLGVCSSFHLIVEHWIDDARTISPKSPSFIVMGRLYRTFGKPYEIIFIDGIQAGEK